MFWSDWYPRSSSSDDTLGIFKYIDQVSFYSKGLDGWHYREVDFKINIFKNGVFYITLLAYSFEQIGKFGKMKVEIGSSGWRGWIDLVEAVCLNVTPSIYEFTRCPNLRF